jgi:hypothetical protein
MSPKLRKKHFKSVIKTLKSADQVSLNDPNCSDDREDILKMIPIYNKVLKGTDTVQEASELVGFLFESIFWFRNNITEPTKDDLNRLWDLSFAKDYLLERHNMKLFTKPNVENLTLDQLKEEILIGSNPKDVLEKDPLWMEIKSQFN